MRIALTLTIAISAVVSLLVGCGEKNDGPSANADMNATCYAVRTQQAATYNTAYAGTACNQDFSLSPGFANYNAQSSYGATSWAGNGCGSYMAMAYSDRKGVSCVETRNFQYSGSPARYQLTYAGVFSLIPLTATTVGINNFSYPNNGYTTTSTTNPIVYRMCADDDPCPSSLRCLSPLGYPRQSGMELGICFH